MCVVLSLCLSGLTIATASASAPIKNGEICKKINQILVQGNFLFRCVKKVNGATWTSSPINRSAIVKKIKLQAINPVAAPISLPTSANPNLQCTGSGELSGIHPGWSSNSAVELTIVNLGNSNFGVYWCPAAAPNGPSKGQGQISYTVTTSPGGFSCETILTFCAVTGISSQSEFFITATDETGTNSSNVIAVQNTGIAYTCYTSVDWCNPGPANLTFPTYGNIAPIEIGDCTFAAVANWEEIVLGKNSDPLQIESEFSNAGGTQDVGLTNDQVFSYWQHHGIGGVYLNAALQFFTDPVHLKNALDDSGIKAVIASLNLSKGQTLAGNTIPQSAYHWVVVDGYTPQGPLIVTWGQTLQMTWQQWNLETVAMWGITTRAEAPVSIP